MKPTEKPILEIDPARVKVMVHREREPVKFGRVSKAMDELGQILPGQVRDIRHWPKEKRQRPGGGLYDFELITGEGRLLRAQKSGVKFRATLETESEEKIVGYFLAENLIRDPLPWWEKAQLVSIDMNSGMSPEDVAAKYFITTNHVAKLRRIASKTATGLEGAIRGLPMNDAEVLTTLPAGDQAIVLEVFQEVGERDLIALTRHAQRLSEAQSGVPLSKAALTGSLKRVDEDLRAIRERLKVIRLHHSLGPQNLEQLLSKPKFRAALVAAKVNIQRFEKLKR